MFFCIAILCVLLAYPVFRGIIHKTQEGIATPANQPSLKSIQDKVGPGETLFDIFKRYGLNMEELFAMKEAAAKVHRLRDIRSGQPYTITIDGNNGVDSFVYWIDDDSLLRIERVDAGFQTTKCKIPYEPRIVTITGTIEDNLVSAVGNSCEEVLLALRVSDIFAWDIDFTSDLRQGDTFTLVVQGLYLDNSLKKYGEVLSAEFTNIGERHLAYRFSYDGKVDYYDEAGNSLRKTFLKAPLSFRRISSTFSNRRFHPVLKTYRPHRGVDYAAAAGTPVSSTANGTVSFTGRKGAYGNLVVLRHRNGYNTYYGHLSRIKAGIHKGVQVNQGDVIGYVGATGLATGPHLHYEMKRAGKHTNPLAVKLAGNPIPADRMAQFKTITMSMDKIIEVRIDGRGSLSTVEKGHKSPGKEG